MSDAADDDRTMLAPATRTGATAPAASDGPATPPAAEGPAKQSIHAPSAPSEPAVAPGDEAPVADAPEPAPPAAATSTAATSTTSSPPAAASAPGVPAGAGPVGHALPVGTRIAEFTVTGVLGIGGFGVVYLARDERLERDVALKEFMPSGFAVRDAAGHVHPGGDEAADVFEIGLRSFVNEARLLAQFDAPSLVKVYRFWEENGTAYMVMPYYRGRTLKQTMAASDAMAAEPALRRMLDSLLDALAILHAQQCYHRDIAPDNIMILDDARPVLLDFGAARRAIGDMPQAFTTIFKQAYAPIEQISESANLQQGPWTDLFALASVIHFVIDRKPPPPAVSRMVTDTYVPLARRYAGRYGAPLLEAVDRALAVRPQDRLQSVQAMRAVLDASPQAAPAAPIDGADAPTVLAVSGTAAAARASDATGTGSTTAAKAGAPIHAAPTGGGKPRWPLAAGAALGLAALAGLAVHFMGKPGDDKAPTPAATSAAPAPAAPAGPGAGAAPAATAPVAAAAVPAPAGPFDPVRALDALVAGADPAFGVRASSNKPRLIVNHDVFGFTIRADRPGYAYLLMLSSGSAAPDMVFPNKYDKNNRVAAGEVLRLPRAGVKLQATGPAGIDRFVAIVSDNPRDFAAAGLETEAGATFSTFSAERLQRATPMAGATSPLAGSAVCDATGPCSQRYGAAAFTVEEAAR